MGYDTTTNYGIRKPILGTFRNEWPVIWRYGLDQIDAAIHTKANLSGASFTGAVRAIKLSVGDNTDYDLNIKNAASSSASANMHLLSGNAAASGVYFSDTDANAMGRVQYEHATDTLKLFSGGATRFAQTTSLTTIDNPTVVNAALSSTGRLRTGTTSDVSSGEVRHVIASSGDAGCFTQWNNPAQSVGGVFGINASGVWQWYKASGGMGSEGYLLQMEVDRNSNLLLNGASATVFAGFSSGASGHAIQGTLPVLALVDSDDTSNAITWLANSGGNTYLYNKSTLGHLALGSRGTEGGRFDASNNFQVGMTGVDYHVFRKDVTGDAGNTIFSVIGQSGATSVNAYGVTAWSVSAANAALKVGKDNVTGASIRTGGTILGSGADAAEYRKNNGLSIPKGQIVGYKTDGTLTLTWSEVTMCRVKATDPYIVGGDAWAAEDKIGKRPDKPQFTPPEYTGRKKPVDLAPQPQAPLFTLTEPAHPGNQADPVSAATYALLKREYDAAAEDHDRAVVAFESAHAAWVLLHDKYQREMADWRTDLVEHNTRVDLERGLFDTAIFPEYQRALLAFEERLEEARKGVDRISYCGIVPCNVTGATPGHYIVAAEGPDDTIIGSSVRRPTEDQWSWVVGRCLRVLPDGRAEIDVMLS